MSDTGASQHELKDTGLNFKEYCVKCKKVVDYPILSSKSRSLFTRCPTCSSTYVLRDLKEVYFAKTDLWVTQFKFGNARGAVVGRLSRLPKQ